MRVLRLPQLSLTQGVLLGGALLTAAIVVAGLFLYSSSNRLTRDEHFNVVHIQPAVSASAKLLVDYLDEEVALGDYVVGSKTTLLGPLHAAEQEIPGETQRLTANIDLFPHGRQALAAELAAHTSWVKDYLEPQLALVRSHHYAAARSVAATTSGASLFGRVRGEFAPLALVIQNAETHNRSGTRRLETDLIGLVIFALALLLLLVISAVGWIVERITLPVEAFAEQAEAIASGGERPLRRPRRSGEVNRIRVAADSIRTQLAAKTLQSQRAREAVRQQSPTVEALVQALRPRIDGHPLVATSVRLDPVEGLLAGDWFDLLAVDEDKLAVVVGDVSGHGPISAVLALRLREVLATHLLGGAAPGEALGLAARSNEDGSADLFATVFCAVLDAAHDRLSYANGGHPAALLHLPDQTAPSIELGPTGPLLSPVVADWRWATEITDFPLSSGLLIYTDGVTEGRDGSGLEYGPGRLAADLSGLAGTDPDQLVDALAAQVDRFVGGVGQDDRTLVYCRHVGHAARAEEPDRNARTSSRPAG